MANKKLLFLLAFAASIILVSCRKEPKSWHGSGEINVSVTSTDLTKSEAATDEAGEILCSVPFKMDNGEQFYLTAYLSDADKVPVNSTKGAPVTTDNISTLYGQFHTSVFKNGTAYTDAEGQSMANVDVVFVSDSEGDRWELTGHSKDAYYWPDDGSGITFCSYAPISTNGTRSSIDWDLTSSKAEFSYQQPDPTTTAPYSDAANQQDLIFAFNKDQNKGSKVEFGKSYAQIHFYHALTAVKFTRGEELNDCKILVVTMENFNSLGNAEFNPDATPRFTWSSQSEPTTYRQTFNSTIDSTIPRATASTPGGSLDPTANEEYTFMMIPQVLPADARILITVEGRLHPIELLLGSVTDAQVGAGNADRLKDWSNYAGKVIIFRVESEKMDMVRVAVDDKATNLIKSDVVTANTGRNGIYLRAALVANCLNDENAITQPYYFSKSISEDGNFTKQSNWGDYWKYNPADGFYYYRYVLPSHHKTAIPLFDTYTVPAGVINNGTGGGVPVYKVKFDIIVQGIDAGPAPTSAGETYSMTGVGNANWTFVTEANGFSKEGSGISL